MRSLFRHNDSQSGNESIDQSKYIPIVESLLQKLEAIWSEGSPSASLSSFTAFVRGILQVGAGLSQSKEVRDLFSDLVEVVVLPLERAVLGFAEIEVLFEGLDCLFDYHIGLGELNRNRYSPSWRRLIAGLRQCTLVLLLTAKNE